MDLAAEFANPQSRLQQVLGRGCPESNDVFRIHEIKLPLEVRAAVCTFAGLRRSVIRRSAFQRVENVDFFARKAAGNDDSIEQLAGPAHERLALPVFISSR